MKSRNAVKINDLTFSYDEEPVLEKINLTIETGKFYGLLGPNGSGKTTLLRAIAGLLDVKTGTILVRDKDLKRFGTRDLAKEMAVVPQNTEVRFGFSVFDLVLMGRAPYLSRFAAEGSKDLRIAQEMMELTDIWRLRDRSINTLSGGEKQRTVIARALTQQTGIILLDEPVSQLDIYHQIEIIKKLKVWNRERGITVVAALHDLNLAAAFCDYLILMNHGKIHSMGTPDEILKRETIKEIYGVEVEIIKTPESGKPYVVPKLSP